MRRGAFVLVISALAVAAGVFSLHVARDDPDNWFAGGSRGAGVALLAAGWALVGCGLAFWWRRPESRFGPLLVAAGFAWFVPELTSLSVDSALAFTAGLTLSTLCAALIGHAVLCYPSGRLSSRLQRAAVSVAYGGAVLVLGLMPTLVNDLAATGCNQCPRNLVLIADHSSAAGDLSRAGVYLGIVWTLALAALALSRLIRGSWSARPLFAAGAVLRADRSDVPQLARAGFVVNGALEPPLARAGGSPRRTVRSGGLGLGSRAARAVGGRTTRCRSVAIAPTGRAPRRPGRDGRRSPLVLAYPFGDLGRLVDAQGHEVELSPEQQRTPLIRDGRPVALLGHAPGFLDDEQLVDEVTAAARLALENERLQAGTGATRGTARLARPHRRDRRRRAQTSRTRPSRRGSAAARGSGAVAPPPALAASRCSLIGRGGRGAAPGHFRARELAHGIFPAVLTDEGFAAASKPWRRRPRS